MKIVLIVRFSDPRAGPEENPDLEIPINYNPQNDNLNKLINTSFCKMMIRQNKPSTERKRLRLIYNGRVINDQTNFSTEILRPKLQQLRNAQEPVDLVRIYIHCLIGEQLTPQQLANERELDRIAQGESTEPLVIGFDRLLLQGVSEIDVNNLRRQFYNIHFPELGLPTRSNEVTDVEEDESRQQYIRQLEERWLESTVAGGQGGQTDALQGTTGIEGGQTDLEGTLHNENLLVGLLIGTFLGVGALIFLMMDDSILNSAQKMAMVLGVLINLFLAFLRIGSIYSA